MKKWYKIQSKNNKHRLNNKVKAKNILQKKSKFWDQK